MNLEFITSKFISKAILELRLLWSFFVHLDKFCTYPGIHGQNCIAEGRKDNIRDRGCDPFNQNFRPVLTGKVVHLLKGTSFFETFPVGPNRSTEFWIENIG